MSGRGVNRSALGVGTATELGRGELVLEPSTVGALGVVESGGCEVGIVGSGVAEVLGEPDWVVVSGAATDPVLSGGCSPSPDPHAVMAPATRIADMAAAR